MALVTLLGDWQHLFDVINQSIVGCFLRLILEFERWKDVNLARSDILNAVSSHLGLPYGSHREGKGGS